MEQVKNVFIGKRLILNLIVLLGLSSGLNAKGLDGFFVSLGYGVAKSNTDFKDVNNGWISGSSGSETGLGSSLKLGYAFNEDFAMYLFRDGAFVFEYENAPNDSIYANCVTGLGTLYYFDSSNIFYTIFGIGTGGFTKLSEVDPMKRDPGYGYVLGLGVNVTENIHAEFSILETDIDDDMDVQTQSSRFIISYYWY